LREKEGERGERERERERERESTRGSIEFCISGSRPFSWLNPLFQSLLLEAFCAILFSDLFPF
jgi:hypothetical protein